MKTLPDKISDLLLLAVKDCEEIETRSNFKLNMGVWCTKSKSGDICNVCMAGAVLVNSLEFDIPNECTMHLPKTIEDKKLTAINEMRIGNFIYACYILNIAIDSFQRNRLCAIEISFQNKYYSGKNPYTGRVSWEDYKEVAEMLAEEGF